MRKISIITASLLLATIGAQAQMFVGEFDAVEKNDTMLVGFFRQADVERYNALMAEWNAMAEKEMQTKGVQSNNAKLKKYTHSASNAEMAKLEQQRTDALKEVDKIAGMLPADQVAAMRKNINDNYDKMIKDTPKMYADMTAQMEGQNAMMTEHDASAFSNDKKYALKRRFAALAVDGKLHGYTRTRNFRHGRAAVCREVYKPENGMKVQHWGFVDESAREVVLCQYFKVCDFNNVTQAVGHGISYDDADSKGWTTVWKSTESGSALGMVDKDGNVKIPCKFAATKTYQRIVFYQTPWGEFAQVCDHATKKCGIIDRQGNYTMQPTETQPIIWYTDIQLFGYRTDDGKLVTFDPYGKRITKTANAK